VVVAAAVSVEVAAAVEAVEAAVVVAGVQAAAGVEAFGSTGAAAAALRGPKGTRSRRRMKSNYEAYSTI
jgi:hypothetical protein